MYVMRATRSFIHLRRVLSESTSAGETEVCIGTGYFTDARALFLCCSVCRVVNSCRFYVGCLQDYGRLLYISILMIT